MHGRKKPRTPRPLNRNPLGTALLGATCLTAAEIEHTMAPLRACEKALREGRATSTQLSVLETTMAIAAAIEKGGMVRGLEEIITEAKSALFDIRQRAASTGTWRPTALYAHELDAVRTGITMHSVQLRKVSASELHRVVDKLIRSTTGQGGEVLRIETETWFVDALPTACHTHKGATS